MIAMLLKSIFLKSLLKQKGMNVTIPDRQSFVRMMAPAYDKVGALAGKQEMTKLLNAVEQARLK